MSQCLSCLLLSAEAYLVPLGKRKKGEEPLSMVRAIGAVREGAGAEGLICTALTPVLQDMAKGLCSVLEIQHL